MAARHVNVNPEAPRDPTSQNGGWVQRERWVRRYGRWFQAGHKDEDMGIERSAIDRSIIAGNFCE